MREGTEGGVRERENSFIDIKRVGLYFRDCSSGLGLHNCLPGSTVSSWN